MGFSASSDKITGPALASYLPMQNWDACLLGRTSRASPLPPKNTRLWGARSYTAPKNVFQQDHGTQNGCRDLARKNRMACFFPGHLENMLCGCFRYQRLLTNMFHQHYHRQYDFEYKLLGIASEQSTGEQA